MKAIAIIGFTASAVGCLFGLLMFTLGNANETIQGAILLSAALLWFFNPSIIHPRVGIRNILPQVTQ